jgi:hypothetical protein
MGKQTVATEGAENAAASVAAETPVTVMTGEVQPFTGAKAAALPFEAYAELDTESDTGRENVFVTMKNPFPDIELEDIRLSFSKPDKKNDWGRPETDVRGEKNKGLFEYKAKPFLRGLGRPLALTGTISYHSYRNRDYVMIEMNEPFAAKVIRMFVRKPAVQAVFEMLAFERLELTPAPRKN